MFDENMPASRARELAVVKSLADGANLADVLKYVDVDDFKYPDIKHVAGVLLRSSSTDRQDIFLNACLDGAKGIECMQVAGEIDYVFGSASTASSYALAMRREIQRTSMLAKLMEAQKDLMGGVNPDEVASRIGMVKDIQGGSVTLLEAYDSAIAQAEKAADLADRGLSYGMKTGLPGVDKRTGGILPGDFWILVAETSAGKSAAITQMIRHGAMQGVKVAKLDLEMTKEDTARRNIAAMAKVNGTKFKLGDRASIAEAKKIRDMVAELPFLIDTEADTHDRIESLVYRWHAEGVQVIVIDHLLCVEFGSRDPHGDMGRLIRMLRRKCLSLDIAIVGVTQYRKETGGQNRTMKDIYGSAAVQHYGMVVMAIHVDADGSDGRRIELYKNRDGVTGLLPQRYEFRGRIQTLVELDTEYCERE